MASVNRAGGGVVGVVMGVCAVLAGSAGEALGQCGFAFGTAIPRTTGPSPQMIAGADFNGDGWTDLVVGTSGSVQLLYANGPGTFAAPVELAGFTALSLTVADLNLDGRPDILTTNGGAVRVFLRSASPTGTGFAAPQLYGLANGGTGAVVADFNLDGRPDFAVDNGSGVSIFAGTAGGTFTLAGSITNVTGGRYLAALDYTLDGRPDVVIMGGEAVRAYAVAGGPSGTVTLTAGPLWTVFGPGSPIVMDRTGDGIPDLLAARSTTNGYTCFELRVTSPGGGLTLVDTGISGMAGVSSLVLGDFNNDGTPELLASGGGDTFVGNTSVETGLTRPGMVAADFDRDGRLDWASFRTSPAQVDVRLSTTPMIVSQPASVIVNPGHPCTFTVNFLGSTPGYRWRRNGQSLLGVPGYSGHNTPTLTVNAPTLADSGAVFDCLVSPVNCAVQVSRGAAMMVVPPAGCGSADFNGDGDIGTDADIEAFFRVLSGGGC